SKLIGQVPISFMAWHDDRASRTRPAPCILTASVNAGDLRLADEALISDQNASRTSSTRGVIAVKENQQRTIVRERVRPIDAGPDLGKPAGDDVGIDFGIQAILRCGGGARTKSRRIRWRIPIGRGAGSDSGQRNQTKRDECRTDSPSP